MANLTSKTLTSPLLQRVLTPAVWFGVFLWGLLWFGSTPHPMETPWAFHLLLLAPLVLVPLVLRILFQMGFWSLNDILPALIVRLQFPTAVCLVLGRFSVYPNVAGALSMPWLITTALIALQGVHMLRSEGTKSMATMGIAIGCIYLLVGGGWTTMAFLQFRPLQFEDVIVLLTGIHFHYAGFLLLVLAGLSAQVWKHVMIRIAVVAAALSVPLVAIGITTTQLGMDPLIESIAASFMAGAGMLVAFVYLKMAWANESLIVKVFWSISGFSLLGSMVLALLYGLRPYHALTWLDIPFLRAWHGSANALGFALPGLLGWQFYKSATSTNSKA